VKTPRISVVVTSYNHEAFVGEALESALAQDYPDFEIVISDDASTDRSPEILRQYAARSPEKIRLLLNQQNVGAVKNTNRALAAVTGELVCFLDSDDVFLPGKLAEQSEVFEDREVVLSYHPSEMFDERGPIRIVDGDSNLANAIDVVRCGGIWCGSSVMVRRDAVPPWGFDERITNVADFIFEVDVAIRGRVAKLSAVLVRYRAHATNLNRRYHEMLPEILRTFHLLEERYRGNAPLVAQCRRSRADECGRRGLALLGRDDREALALLARATVADPRRVRWALVERLMRFRLARSTAAWLKPAFRKLRTP
jgi:glycosyltransferase involved in cell wall biosynthesis